MWWVAVSLASSLDAPYARGSRAGAHMRVGGDCAPRHRHRAHRIAHAPACAHAAAHAGTSAGGAGSRVVSGAADRTRRTRSSRRCLFMNKGKFGVRSPKSTFAVLQLQRPTTERPVDGSWRVLFRCWWSAPTCPGRSVKIRIDLFLCS